MTIFSMWSAGSIGVVGFGTNHIFSETFFNLEITTANPNKNNIYGIPRSRGHNFQFKNVELFKIHQNLAEIGRFEFGTSRETTDLLDFLCICKGNVKGNQANRGKSSKSTVSEGNSKFKSTYLGDFFTDFKNVDIFEQEIMPSRA